MGVSKALDDHTGFNLCVGKELDQPSLIRIHSTGPRRSECSSWLRCKAWSRLFAWTLKKRMTSLILTLTECFGMQLTLLADAFVEKVLK